LESSKNVGTKVTLDFLAHFIPAHQDNQIFAKQVLKHNQQLGNKSDEYEIIKLNPECDRFKTCMIKDQENDSF
jgi:hypothetical protein